MADTQAALSDDKKAVTPQQIIDLCDRACRRILNRQNAIVGAPILQRGKNILKFLAGQAFSPITEIINQRLFRECTRRAVKCDGSSKRMRTARKLQCPDVTPLRRAADRHDYIHKTLRFIGVIFVGKAGGRFVQNLLFASRLKHRHPTRFLIQRHLPHNIHTPLKH